MKIMLHNIWPIENSGDYKIHFARWNQHIHPLDHWLINTKNWDDWQQYYPNRDDFNRPFIFSLMQFYLDDNCWLFGGVYKVVRLNYNQDDPTESYYEVKLTNQGECFIGRLKVHYPYKKRSTRVAMENHYENLEIKEILREIYTGKEFPGYENIEVSFSELEFIVKKERPDWKSHLKHVKGVYLLTDTNTQRRYVGSAYGVHGIWSRWKSYVESGHGGNIELRKLFHDNGLSYFQDYFRFSLLEYRGSVTPDDVIIARENHWKQVLLTRGEGGLNQN